MSKTRRTAREHDNADDTDLLDLDSTSYPVMKASGRASSSNKTSLGDSDRVRPNTSDQTAVGASSFRLASANLDDHIDEDPVGEYTVRFQKVRDQEERKDKLIDDLLNYCKALTEKHRTLQDDYEREQDSSRHSQRDKKIIAQQLRAYQEHMQIEPFVLILIDADGMIFQDELLKKGEDGGREAAHLLSEAIANQLRSRSDIQDLPPGTKYVARLYANMRGLGNTLCQAGIVDSPHYLEEFLKGFTRGKALFDFVDVGAGKDRADEKLTELFKLHLRNLHCRHIVFGGSHDNGYARTLEEVVIDERLKHKITLLEGVPFERELKNLPFATLKFERIFRTTKIDIHQPLPPVTRVPSESSVEGSSGISEGDTRPAMDIRSHLPPARVATVKTPVLSVASGSEPPQLRSPKGTWAVAVQKSPENAKPTPPPSVSSTDKRSEIPRNRRGQRVDPVIKHDKHEVERIKSLKLCNIHYLRHECPYGYNCTHRHDLNLTKGELEALRAVARMAPCMNGSECDDPKCTYGHVCPAPEGRNGQLCIFGDSCRFKKEVHNVDRTIVKTVKV